MALLDKEFRKQCKPTILLLERSSSILNGKLNHDKLRIALPCSDLAVLGESDITLEFSESSMARNIFSHMDALSCLYTVQIIPRTDQDSMEVFVFEKEVERIFSGLSIFNTR